MYRIIYRGGDYRDTDTVPVAEAWSQWPGNPIWAVVNLDIVEGGDAYQALLRTLEATAE